MDPRFELRFLEPTVEFLEKQPASVSQKILFNIEKARQSNDPELFKKLDDDIWEFRTTYNGIRYRLLAFWDKRKKANILVVCTHGIIKKTSKVPSKEIKRARSIMILYLANP